MIDLQAALTLAHEAKARADAATPGPRIKLTCRGCKCYETKAYRVQGDSGYEAYCVNETLDGGSKYIGECAFHNVPEWCPGSRTDVPALAELVEKLVEEVARVRAETIASVLLITSNYRCEQEDCACVDCAVIRAAEAKIKRLEKP